MENLKIINKKENKLFNRKEIIIGVESKITPNKKETEKLISEKLSVEIEKIKIKKIQGKFGSNDFTILTNIYDSKKDKDEIEPKEKNESTTNENQEIKAEEPKVEENKVEENKEGEEKS